jgi:hypothetical protein
VDREQLLTAIYSALQAASTGSLKTKTLHSEVLLSLHPSATVSLFILSSFQAFEAAEDEVLIIWIGAPPRIQIASQPQINEALRKFGISATTKNLILVRIGPPSSSSSASTSTSSPPSSDEDAKAEHEQKLVDAMSDLVEGEMTSLSQLRESDVDWKGLKKVGVRLLFALAACSPAVMGLIEGLVLWTLHLQLYKLNEMNLAPNAPSTETEKDMLAAVITSTIATKTVAG